MFDQRFWWRFGAALVLVVGSYVAGRRIGLVAKGPNLPEASPSSPVVQTKAGRQLLMVYVGSSRCGVCRSPELPPLIKAITDSLVVRGGSTGRELVKIGIAPELSSSSGISHLNLIGRFDEVSAGLGVLNQTNRHFVGVTHPGIQATPQVVLLERTSRHTEQGVIDDATVTEEVLTRKVGIQELANWLRLGVPIPSSARRKTDSVSY